MTALALIPARSGSKRCPGKNTADVCGRPAMAWVLSAATDCEGFDEIAVSTDDPMAAMIAVSHGATVIQRPPKLGTDAAKLIDVCRHALGHHSVVCCIAATACMLEPMDLVASGVSFDSEVMLSCLLYEGKYLAATGTFIWMTRAWLMSGAADFYDSRHVSICVIEPLKGLDVDTPEDLERLRMVKGMSGWGGTA